MSYLPGLVRGKATLCHFMAHSAQDKSCFFHHCPLLLPSHALQPLAQLLQSQHTTEVQEAAHSSQPIHFSSSSDAADSSPAPYKMLRMQPHTLYAGNCESAFLQKLGLVMSFLTTDPNIYHSSRVKYKSTVYTVSSSVSETLDVACWA